MPAKLKILIIIGSIGLGNFYVIIYFIMDNILIISHLRFFIEPLKNNFCLQRQNTKIKEESCTALEEPEKALGSQRLDKEKVSEEGTLSDVSEKSKKKLTAVTSSKQKRTTKLSGASKKINNLEQQANSKNIERTTTSEESKNTDPMTDHVENNKNSDANDALEEKKSQSATSNGK